MIYKSKYRNSNTKAVSFYIDIYSVILITFRTSLISLHLLSSTGVELALLFFAFYINLLLQ